MKDQEPRIGRKVFNLAVVGLLVLVLMGLSMRYGRNSLSNAEIAGRYHAGFGITQKTDEAVLRYPYESSTPDRLYLDLVKITLTDSLYDHPVESLKTRREGGLWPSRAMTMLTLKRLDNIQACMTEVLEKGIPGDFIEAGVWRGGATIFMRAVLKARNVSTRTVWVADSFEGLPPPDAENFPADAGSDLHEYEVLAVSKEAVEQNFRRYGLLDGQVKFLKGWFKDTLAAAPIEKLAVLRIDADLYESTTQALETLYPKVSPGGFVIIDDFHDIAACSKAVNDYRRKGQIDEPMLEIDGSAIYWQKTEIAP